MSVGTVEIPHLLWPGRSEWMVQSVSLLRFCTRMNMWLRTLLCLQLHLPPFNIVVQLLRVCSIVLWCEHNSHLELDLFPHLMRLLFVGRVSRTELSKNCSVFLVSWTYRTSMLYLKVQLFKPEKVTLNKVLIWDIHVSFISSLIDLVIVFLTFVKFWTVRSIVSVTCFSLFSQYITVENFLCHISSRSIHFALIPQLMHQSIGRGNEQTLGFLTQKTNCIRVPTMNHSWMSESPTFSRIHSYFNVRIPQGQY